MVMKISMVNKWELKSTIKMDDRELDSRLSAIENSIALILDFFKKNLNEDNNETEFKTREKGEENG